MTWSLGLWLLALAFSQEKDDGRRGAVQLRFRERHPLGSMAEQSKRFRWKEDFVRKNDPDRGEYRVGDLAFQGLVPADYDGSRPYGLLVWISPGSSGRVPAAWHEVLAKSKFLAVGADNSGNERLVWYRMGFALDAVHGMKKRYSIDDKRIVVAGFSGGGRIAGRLGFHYPDVFTGGMYLGGADFWSDIPTPSDPKRAWPAQFPKPADKLLEQTRKKSRHVLVVGERDMNRAFVKAMHDHIAAKEKFEHLKYLEMPDLGHVSPDGAWFEKALRAVDVP